VVAIKAIVLATKAWTVAQVALDAAMDANPITLVIGALAFLAGAFVVVYPKVKSFRDAVNDTSNWLETTTTNTVNWVVGPFNGMVNFFSSVPGKIATAVSGLWDGLKGDPVDVINWLIGKLDLLHFKVPSWVLVIGGGVGLQHLADRHGRPVRSERGQRERSHRVPRRTWLGGLVRKSGFYTVGEAYPHKTLRCVFDGALRQTHSLPQRSVAVKVTRPRLLPPDRRADRRE